MQDQYRTDRYDKPVFTRDLSRDDDYTVHKTYLDIATNDGVIRFSLVSKSPNPIKYLDIRRYRRSPENGKLVPTRRGACIRNTNINDAIEALELAKIDLIDQEIGEDTDFDFDESN